MSTQAHYQSGREHDPALLSAGHETGWWDDRGRPAPWPQDFWLAEGTINPDWQPDGRLPGHEPLPNHQEGDQPF